MYMYHRGQLLVEGTPMYVSRKRGEIGGWWGEVPIIFSYRLGYKAPSRDTEV